MCLFYEFYGQNPEMEYKNTKRRGDNSEAESKRWIRQLGACRVSIHVQDWSDPWKGNFDIFVTRNK